MEKCKKCPKIMVLTLVKEKWYGKSGMIKTYVDQAGQTCYGGICFDCRKAMHRSWVQRSGRNRDASKNHITAKAVAAEMAAEKKFLSLGFSVKRTTEHGPDLFCKIGEMTWTVEVKSATRNSGRGGFFVSAVCPKRLGDDLVAIVGPGEVVIIDSMHFHLSKCSKNGKRTVSEMFR